MNKVGKIVVKFTIVNYYDENGLIESTTPSKEFELTIEGFKKVSATTSISNNVLSGVSNIFASEALSDENYSSLLRAIASNVIDNVDGTVVTESDVVVALVSSSDYKGTLELKVKIINSKGQLDGEIQPTLDLGSILFEGFRINKELLTTTFVGGEVSGFENTLPSEISVDSASFKEALAKMIKNPVENQTITSSDIEIVSLSPNNKEGKLVVSIRLNNSKGWIDGTPQQTINFDNVTIIGFKVQLPTTQIVTEVAIQGQENTIPESLTDANLKSFIFSNKDKLFNNLPSNFLENNIIIKNFEPDNPTGKVLVVFKINNFYNQDGILQDGIESSDFEVTFTGFKKDTTTTSISNLELQGVSNILPSTYQANDSQIKSAIAKNVENLVAGQTLSSNDIVIEYKSHSDALGTLTLKVKIINNKAQQSGVPQTEFDLGQFTFTGFKWNDELRTTTFVGGQVLGFENTLPSEISIDSASFKEALAKMIKYPVENQTITSSDIEIVSLSPNNKEGKLIVSIRLKNNKGWIDGAPQQTINFDNVTITGFKVQLPTRPTNTSYITLNNSNILPSEFSSNDVLNEIFSKINELFTNLPSDLNKSDIKIVKISPNNAGGNINVNFDVLRYYNDEGLLVDFNSGAIALSHSIELRGFKKDDSSTGFESLVISDSSLSNLYAPLVYDDFANNKLTESELNIIKNALIKKVLNPVKPLTSSDIEIYIKDNTLEVITVRVTFKAGTCKENGVILDEDKVFESITLKGFHSLSLEQATTSIDEFKNMIDLSQINSLKDLTLDDIKSNKNNSLNEIKKQIISEGIVINTVPNTSLTLNDIEIIFNDNNQQDAKEALITIKINNKKAWSNAKLIETMTFENAIKLTGYKLEDSKKNLSSVLGGIILIIGGVLLIAIVVFMLIKKNKGSGGKSGEKFTLIDEERHYNDATKTAYYEPEPEEYHENWNYDENNNDEINFTNY